MQYRVLRIHKKARAAAGLFGRVNRLAMGVSVGFDPKPHIRNFDHNAIVSNCLVHVSKYPVAKAPGLKLRVLTVHDVALKNALKCGLLFVRELAKLFYDVGIH